MNDETGPPTFGIDPLHTDAVFVAAQVDFLREGYPGLCRDIGRGFDCNIDVERPAVGVEPDVMVCNLFDDSFEYCVVGEAFWDRAIGRDNYLLVVAVVR